MVEVFEKTIETLRTLGSFCSERFEDEEAPDFYNLINAIDEMREYFAGQLGDETAVASTPEAAMAVAPGVPAAAGGPIQSRQEALHQLQLVGDWFRRSEPHSPISYLVARAVKWGSMPLDQLFKDVVRNDDVIDHIWETLGLDASASDASSGEGEDDY
jgi:type VI secretion system protein ImpA